MKTIFRILILFSFLFFALGVYSEEEKIIKISNFEPKDLNKGIFSVELIANNSQIYKELCKVNDDSPEKYPSFSSCDFSIQLGSRVMGFILDSFFLQGLVLKFDTIDKKGISYGKRVKVRLVQGSKVLDEEKFFIPQSSGHPPSVVRFFPIAGTRGDHIKLYGRNLGENLDKIKIYFIYENNNYTQRNQKFIILGYTYPNYVTSPNADGIQEVQFTIPDILKISNKLNFFTEGIQVKVHANYQEAYHESQESLEFQLLNPNWKWSLLGGSLGILLFFYFIIAIVFKNIFWIRYYYLDRKVNKLSLARFDFISWSFIFLLTLVYMFLFYLFFNQYYNLLRWENSLFALTLVVYIPIFLSYVLDKIYPKNELSFTKPHFTDLIFSRGSLDVIRLQLLGFSTFTKLLFLYILFSTNFFENSLQVPYHFIGFMGASRLVYLIGKFFRDEVAIQNIEPYEWNNDSLPVQVTLFGYGFQEGQKVQIGDSSLVKLKVQNSNKAEFLWEKKLSEGIFSISIYSQKGEISRTLPCIVIQKSPVEPNPFSPLSVESNSSTSSISK